MSSIMGDFKESWSMHLLVGFNRVIILIITLSSFLFCHILIFVLILTLDINQLAINEAEFASLEINLILRNV